MGDRVGSGGNRSSDALLNLHGVPVCAMSGRASWLTKRQGSLHPVAGAGVQDCAGKQDSKAAEQCTMLRMASHRNCGQQVHHLDHGLVSTSSYVHLRVPGLDTQLARIEQIGLIGQWDIYSFSASFIASFDRTQNPTPTSLELNKISERFMRGGCIGAMLQPVRCSAGTFNVVSDASKFILVSDFKAFNNI